MFPESRQTAINPRIHYREVLEYSGGQETVRREKGPGALPLSVTNFTLCWEKSTETLDFPACHALLLNTERLVLVLNAPCKQL